MHPIALCGSRRLDSVLPPESTLQKGAHMRTTHRTVWRESCESDPQTGRPTDNLIWPRRVPARTRLWSWRQIEDILVLGTITLVLALALIGMIEGW